MNYSSQAETLRRIQSALEATRDVLSRFTSGTIEAEYKACHDSVTVADTAVNAVLRENLLRDGEGWLSDESVDDFSRLQKIRVWVVDPLDGTREFVAGVPEFCVSIANGRKWPPRSWRNLQIQRLMKFCLDLSRGASPTTANPRARVSRPLWSGALILATVSITDFCTLVYMSVASHAKSDQILVRVVSSLAAKFLVVNLKIRHRAAALTSPTVST